MNTDLRMKAMALQPELSARRRDFHRHAESGWLEYRTTAAIVKELQTLGYETIYGRELCDAEGRMGVPDAEVLEREEARAIAQGADPDLVAKMKGGFTGAIGIMKNGDGPVLALRFDIDALGVIEAEDSTHLPKKQGFASINHGSMHACGHDGHATIGLGTAKLMAEEKANWQGTLKLIFQPAEEGVRGAKSIVDAGHLDGVDFLLASHIRGAGPKTKGDYHPGAGGSLATVKLDVFFEGVSAHAGGSPENGKNAILALSNAVINLYAISRHSKGATRINVGRVQGGTGRNVIADEAMMELEIRGETDELCDYMLKRAEEILKASAMLQDVRVHWRKMGAASSMQSDHEMEERLIKSLSKAGLVSAPEREVDLGGSEDCAYFMNRVQEQGGLASYMLLLTPTAAGAHNRAYDFGEDVLSRGVLAFTAASLDILAKA